MAVMELEDGFLMDVASEDMTLMDLYDQKVDDRYRASCEREDRFQMFDLD